MDSLFTKNRLDSYLSYCWRKSWGGAALARFRGPWPSPPFWPRRQGRRSGPCCWDGAGRRRSMPPALALVCWASGWGCCWCGARHQSRASALVTQSLCRVQCVGAGRGAGLALGYIQADGPRLGRAVWRIRAKKLGGRRAGAGCAVSRRPPGC